ncbi:MAG: tetratricopeptide repeat protein [Sedimentisphaerales bacterium]|nr:tetratricopeptide repeat protein [Sedimentisphaerales bacterium]
MTRTVAAAQTTSNTTSARNEARRQIVMPLSQSTEAVTSEDRSQKSEVGRQKSEDRIRERTQRTQIATPITQTVERAQPRNEQQQTAPPTAPSVNTERNERRARVTSPAERSVEVAKSEVRIREETRPAEIAQPIAPSVEPSPSRIERPTQAAPTANAGSDKTLTPEVTTKQRPDTKQLIIRDDARRRPDTKQIIARSDAEKVDRTQRREKIVRGTAGREVGTPGAGKKMNVERAVNAVDERSNHKTIKNDTTIINNNKTIVNNFADQRNRRDNREVAWNKNNRDDHDGRWWNRGGHNNDNRHYDNRGHHSNVFLSLGFYSGYSYSAWSPVVYEPAVYTSVAYGPVWPLQYRAIYYNRGPQYAVSYVYPSYHRRYVFMSVGGYWPSYPYARYYWYDCHPWYWYGAAPVAYQVGGGDTNNYYTYNYYGSDNATTTTSSTGALTPGTIVNGVEVPDYDALRSAAGRQVTVPPQAAAQTPPEQPAAPTESDKLFDAGVTAFGDGNYPTAIETFQRAVRLEPNDVILPFAYSQALFANNDYEQAAAVLQTALTGMAPAKPEVFFPRGLYKDDAVLAMQIKNLERAVMMNPTNSGLQLLYGYQLLGIGKMDDAKVPLGVAQRDARTAGPASALLNLIDRVKAESQTKK